MLWKESEPRSSRRALATSAVDPSPLGVGLARDARVCVPKKNVFRFFLIYTFGRSLPEFLLARLSERRAMHLTTPLVLAPRDERELHAAGATTRAVKPLLVAETERS